MSETRDRIMAAAAELCDQLEQSEARYRAMDERCQDAEAQLETARHLTVTAANERDALRTQLEELRRQERERNWRVVFDEKGVPVHLEIGNMRWLVQPIEKASP